MTKRQKEQHKRRSKGMKAAWERRREREAMNKKLAEAKSAELAAKYDSPVMGYEREQISPLPEWKSPDPLEVQLKEAHATIDRLRHQLNKYQAFREVINSLKSSMSGMISIVNSTNVILEND